jgi:hypothetical protein
MKKIICTKGSAGCCNGARVAPCDARVHRGSGDILLNFRVWYVIYVYTSVEKVIYTSFGKAYSMQGASHVGRCKTARVRGFLVQSNQDVGGILEEIKWAGDVI